MRKKQQAAFQSLSATFPSATVEKWSKMVDDWEKDMTKPNPYEESNTSVFLSTLSSECSLNLTKPQLSRMFAWSLQRKMR